MSGAAVDYRAVTELSLTIRENKKQTVYCIVLLVGILDFSLFFMLVIKIYI